PRPTVHLCRILYHCYEPIRPPGKNSFSHQPPRWPRRVTSGTSEGKAPSAGRLPPEDEGHDLVDVGLGGDTGAHVPAVLQDHDPVAHIEDLFDPVVDDDHRHTLGLQGPHHPHHLL